MVRLVFYFGVEIRLWDQAPNFQENVAVNYIQYLPVDSMQMSQQWYLTSQSDSS